MQRVKSIIRRFLINNQIRRNSKKYKNKIKAINKDFTDGEKEQFYQDHLIKWSVFDEKITGDWLAAYSRVNKIHSPDYVPESIYYSYLEPVLNRYEHNISYSDKNFYDLMYREDLFPETLIRNIDDSFFDQAYNPIDSLDDFIDSLKSKYDELILKPSIETGGGVNVMSFVLEDNEFVSSEKKVFLNKRFLEENFKSNFLIQKKMKSNSFLSKFNPSSLNTIRVLMYRRVVTNEVVALNCVLRVGAEGAVVDNSRAGGVAIGIDSNGKLNNFATDKKGNKVYDLKGIDLLETQFIPKYDEIISTCEEIAEKNIHHRLLGMDMTIDENGKVRCVEVNNNGNEINFFQFNNGPLFHEFTDEIIKHCLVRQDEIYKNYII